MPLRSVAQLRVWLIPWALAPLAILALAFMRATPPRELWLPMILTSVGAFLLAGVVTALCWALAIAALELPPASVHSLVLAALGAMAASRVASSTAAMHGPPAAAPTT